MDRKKFLIDNKYLSLRELGAVLGVSKQRVYQLYKKYGIDRGDIALEVLAEFRDYISVTHFDVDCYARERGFGKKRIVNALRAGKITVLCSHVIDKLRWIRWCCGCNKTMSLDEFYKSHVDGADDVRSRYCISCTKKTVLNYRNTVSRMVREAGYKHPRHGFKGDKGHKLAKRNKILFASGKRYCSKCNEEKDLDKFNILKSSGKHAGNCKLCNSKNAVVRFNRAVKVYKRIKQ